MKEHLVRLLIHPFFIGGVITLLIFLLVNPEIQRYKVSDLERTRFLGFQKLYFADLDGDGNSEEINVENAPGIFKLMVYSQEKLINQYNLASYPIADQFMLTEDCTGDGLKDIFLLTERNDSIFLSLVDPLSQNRFMVKERLVFHHDTVSFRVDSPQGIILGKWLDTNGNAMIYFAVNTGFSKQPRNFYCYDFRSDRLRISPVSGASIYEPFLKDINGDTLPEIITGSMATWNYHGEIPYSDRSAWMMAFDHQLNFLFSPLEFPGYPAKLQVQAMAAGDSLFLVAMHDYYGPDSIQSALYLFDQEGELLRSRKIPTRNRGHYRFLVAEKSGESNIYLLDQEERRVRMYDHRLQCKGERVIPDLFSGIEMYRYDLDGDGSNENVMLGHDLGGLVIFRADFRYPLEINLDEDSYPHHFSGYLDHGKNRLFVEFEHYGYFLNYERNPLFYLKYLVVAGAYLTISLLVLLVYRIQNYRARLQYDNQRKIQELQILSLKNQLDPHFTFNILNSIGSIYVKNEGNRTAYNILVKYSELLRSAIKNSDQVAVSLEEELGFVRNYIELEQANTLRPFSCRFSVSPEVDQKMRIPRMLIHTFVENAIKHGIRRREKPGELRIGVNRRDGKYKSVEIEIRDSGPVSSDDKGIVPGTGKGLQIVDELIRLFNRIEGTRIHYEWRKREEGGTEVKIIIPDE